MNSGDSYPFSSYSVSSVCLADSCADSQTVCPDNRVDSRNIHQTESFADSRTLQAESFADSQSVQTENYADSQAGQVSSSVSEGQVYRQADSQAWDINDPDIPARLEQHVSFQM